MTQLFANEHAAHWYRLDGTPCHTVPKKTGGGERAVTVNDALELNLVPSVTTILKTVHSWRLENWKKEQLVLAALTLPRLEGEGEDAFAKRVIEDADEQSSAARDQGTLIHAFMERIVRNLDPPDDLIAEHFELYAGMLGWWKASGWSTASSEESFADRVEGYGGRVDWTGYAGRWGSRFLTVADFKTQTTSPGTPFRFYKDWGVQLVAYARGLGHPGASLISVVISRNEPGRVEAYTWIPALHEKLWRAFVAARDLFYSPLGRGDKLPIARVTADELAAEKRVETDALFSRIESASPHPGLVRGRARNVALD